MRHRITPFSFVYLLRCVSKSNVLKKMTIPKINFKRLLRYVCRRRNRGLFVQIWHMQRMGHRAVNSSHLLCQSTRRPHTERKNETSGPRLRRNAEEENLYHDRCTGCRDLPTGSCRPLSPMPTISARRVDHPCRDTQAVTTNVRKWTPSANGDTVAERDRRKQFDRSSHRSHLS